MWLKRLVGIMMIAAFLVMNSLTVYGLVFPKKVVKPAIQSSAPVQIAPPTVTLSATPGTVSVGDDSALKWSTTGDPKCVATSTVDGPWTGEKTQFGAESSGVLKKEGKFTYNLKCTNDGGTTDATATITVTASKQTASNLSSSSSQSTSTTTSTSATYCNGRTPCYGPKDVASHASAGNCWGWNVDKVYNITSFDTGYHKDKSGIGTIEVSGVCGKDLTGSLVGTVSAGGQTRNHLQSTKTNASANTNPYMVGYYDAKKP